MPVPMPKEIIELKEKIVETMTKLSKQVNDPK